MKAWVAMTLVLGGLVALITVGIATDMSPSTVVVVLAAMCAAAVLLDRWVFA